MGNLPRVRGVRRVRRGASSSNWPRNQKKKIIIVDNHPVILKYMTDLLEKQGYRVKTAKDSLSALEIIDAWIPDAMFIDMVMPNISGDKLCKIIRSMPELNEVYIIIFSVIVILSLYNSIKYIPLSRYSPEICISLL